MPEETIATGESGAATGASTGPAAGGEETSGTIDDVGTDAAATAATDTDDEQVDEDAAAAAEIADQQTDQTDKPAPAEDQASVTDDKAAEPKSIREAREQINSLEGQIRPLRELEQKVLEIGGLPTLEMVQPLIDVALNPEATAEEFFATIANVAPHLNPDELAWGLLENERNQAAAVQHFYGENITPEILTKLVEGYERGDYEIADEDDFLTDAERRERDRARTADREARNSRQADNDRRRTEALTAVATLCGTTIDKVLEPYAITEKDTPEIKELKEFLNGAVHSQIMRELHSDPVFQRVQALLKRDGFQAADALAKGSLAPKINALAEKLVKQFQPLVPAAIGKAQAHAKKIKEVRDEPTGVRTQADAAPAEAEISARDPNWREKLDEQYRRKVQAMTQPRRAGGQFS